MIFKIPKSYQTPKTSGELLQGIQLIFMSFWHEKTKHFSFSFFDVKIMLFMIILLPFMGNHYSKMLTQLKTLVFEQRRHSELSKNFGRLEKYCLSLEKCGSTDF